MPKKYHIAVQAVPPRFPPVPRLASFEDEGCLGCVKCAKRTCVYNVYGKRRFVPGLVTDTADNLCVNCMSCVQECKKNILSRVRNPAFDRMGDDYWKPEIIASIWKQAETGQIPVSGAGFRGPFTGPGFDRVWTDMSEIVRPTRDGIHGREYISTVIELGRRPARLSFDAQGRLLTEPLPFLELPLPIVLDIPSRGIVSESARLAMASAAGRLGTLAVAAADEARRVLARHRPRLLVKLDPDRIGADWLAEVPLAELPYSENVIQLAKKVKARGLARIVSVRLPLDEHAPDRAAELAAAGADLIHLQADDHGRGFGSRRDAFVATLVREVHQRLLADLIRDQLTLLVSGGIALAEHVAKAILCGADGVGVDEALLVALECRLCGNCREGRDCPVEMDRVPADWAADRIVNLLGSWHAQLIEVMGAMGLREVRRLRGEMGRAMIFEDLERECFAPIFGARVENPAAGREAPQAPASDPEPDFAAPAEFMAGAAPSRYRNRLSEYKVVRTADCNHCGKCAEVCAFGAHQMAGQRLLAPRSHLCRGPEVCRDRDAYCVDHCPEQALLVGPDPSWQAFGDPRWTADLLTSTWVQAETGRPPENGLEYKVGASGGGFDRMDFAFPPELPEPSLKPAEIDLSLPLNRRRDDRPQITIGFPIYGGGMSFGSVSLATIIARARAYQAFNSFTCTGEGGYPEELTEYDDHVITQVATGLFGVREETIQRVRIVEFKYAQGAKPGLGGHLLGDKVTPAVARMREAVEGSSLFSPFPFHSVYSVEDHKKHVDWVKVLNPKALVAVKVSTPNDVDMVAVGSYYAGAHIIHLDGSYGGTGAAPDIAKKNIAMPIEYAIPKVHRFLVEEGIRERMTLIVSGGLRTAWDVAKAIALGADGVVIGTAELVALECIRCGNCESGRGCPRGIATTDPELSTLYNAEWGAQRIINLFHSWSRQLREILRRFGMRSVRELTGRSDLLVHLDYQRPRRELAPGISLPEPAQVSAGN